jgi:predicted nucleotidyltransferase
VDSTAARSRPTTSSAFASETPALSYVGVKMRQSTTVPRQESPTEYLRAVAHRITGVVIEEVSPRAVLLVGSAATGDADLYSDLDLIVYCDALPAVELVDAVVERLGGSRRELIYPRTEDDHGEAFVLDGIECQLAFTRVSAAARELERAIGTDELESPLQKVVQGLQEGAARRGADRVVACSRRRIPGLAAPGDDRAALALVAVLGALNRLYVAPRFELKRLRKLTARMTLAPPDLANRLERLFEVDGEEAAEELERLVQETQTLVEAELPDLELPSLRRPLGARHEQFRLP